MEVVGLHPIWDTCVKAGLTGFADRLVVIFEKKREVKVAFMLLA